LIFPLQESESRCPSSGGNDQKDGDETYLGVPYGPAFGGRKLGDFFFAEIGLGAAPG
jgi:hypothetical protein